MTSNQRRPDPLPRHTRVRYIAQTALLVPRNCGVAVLRTYRAVVSPLYGDVCRYYPSCSHYSLQAVQAHGLVKGSWLTARRLVRCHPWAQGGIDDIPPGTREDTHVTTCGFVVLNRRNQNKQERA
jgi:putative membrane protein insertion efficiency factor